MGTQRVHEKSLHEKILIENLKKSKTGSKEIFP